jgi:hypothetical protein
MIEDKELGLKVAEDTEEALWTKVKDEAEQLIKQSENNLIIQKAMKELAEQKLSK